MIKLNWIIILVSGCGFFSGCSSMIQTLVDTQPKVNLTQKDYQSPEKIVKGFPIAYIFQGESSENLDDDLVRFAPTIVQGFQSQDPDFKSNKYNYWNDGIGQPYLVKNSQAVQIDTEKPTVFSRLEYTQVHDNTLKQLVYVWWYPCKPVGSIEKGEIDGNILRITLDAFGRPSIFEYSQSCGCYHGVFAAQYLEQQATQEYIRPEPGKKYCLEKNHPLHTDWIIRDLISVENDQKPIIFISAGKHFCEAIRFQNNYEHNISTKGYILNSYDSLMNIPKDNGGNGCMFNENGLVWGARRSGEEFFLSDMDHPGWPRHLDRMRIHWDQAHWNEPHLLEEYLRLPISIVTSKEALQTTILSKEIYETKKQASFDSNSIQTVICEKTVCKLVDGKQQTEIETNSGNSDKKEVINNQVINQQLNEISNLQKDIEKLFSTSDQNKPTLVLVTHKFCLGCQGIKKYVLPLPKVKKALEKWNFFILDMYNEQDRKIAEQFQIQYTPTIIALDFNYHEVVRSFEIDSEEKFLGFLSSSNTKISLQ